MSRVKCVTESSTLQDEVRRLLRTAVPGAADNHHC